MRLVLIETLGNQAHVFSSNRLREMIGASEQIRQLGTDWVRSACKGLGAQTVLATSGKAMVLVDDKVSADTLVTRVVTAALQKAPGLAVMGAHVEIDMTAGALAFHDGVTAVHRELGRLRGLYPPAQAHLARLPFAEDCHSTGQGAAGYDPYDPASAGDPLPYSAATLAKRAMRPDAIANLKDVLGPMFDKAGTEEQHRAGTPDAPNGLDDFNATWWAVVHADGNGMGEIFLRFGDCVAEAGGKTADDYIKAYQTFSQALDDANSKAVNAATRETWKEIFGQGEVDLRRVPMKPVVLAGDDLTVICDGARAVQFASAFVENFRKETEVSPAISRIMLAAKNLRGAEEKLLGTEEKPSSRSFEGITSGAGIAIVKPHHPFHRAYELAEALAKSAKGLPKRHNLSALDFHVAYDGASDLDEIRQTKSKAERLFAGPYLTGAPSVDKHAFRTVAQLVDLVTGFGRPVQADGPPEPAGEEEDAYIPASQLHALRDAVSLGESVANAAVARIQSRYSRAFERLPGIAPLFVAGLDGGPRRTMLLDAMVLADVIASDPLSNETGQEEADR